MYNDWFYALKEIDYEKKCKNPRCQCLFVPDRFNRHHHDYCPKAECKSLRDAIRRKRWRDKKKRDVEFLANEVKRVQNYRRKGKKKSSSQSKETVDSRRSPRIDSESSEHKLAIRLMELQEALYQGRMIISGLVAHFLGTDFPELVDTLIPFLERCQKQGQDIYRLSPAKDLINVSGWP